MHNSAMNRSHLNALRLAIGALILADGRAFAQSPTTRPVFDAFEVAAIKPPDADAKGRWIRMQSAHQFMAHNHALKTLLAAAYNLSTVAISGGPAWVESERYDILAKTPGEVRPSLDDQMAMLRKLLSERFQLSVHHEEKQLSIYELTVAKGGPKLKGSVESPDTNPQGPPPLIFVLSPQVVRLPGRSATMAELASVMQRAALDRPVVDKTGLSGRYDFDLEWTPEEDQFGGAGLKGTLESSKPGLFAAIQQQLGLKLEATRGLIDALVIDRAERPSAN
jgi:uncharacterized protein (TIGR03435 family)